MDREVVLKMDDEEVYDRLSDERVSVEFNPRNERYRFQAEPSRDLRSYRVEGKWRRDWVDAVMDGFDYIDGFICLKHL